jgi:hypothetical protein
MESCKIALRSDPAWRPLRQERQQRLSALKADFEFRLKLVEEKEEGAEKARLLWEGRGEAILAREAAITQKERELETLSQSLKVRYMRTWSL